MQAFRNTYILENNTLTITLPESFSYKSVDVIVLPATDSQATENNLKYQRSDSIKRLLSLSVWDVEKE